MRIAAHVGDAATFVALMARCRRRAALVRFVRYACISTTAALLLTEAVVATGAHVDVVSTAAGLFTAAMTIAAAAALARRPTSRQVAAVIDSRLHLQDRIVTAVQFLERPDPFSRLVVHDALQRLVDVEASAVFPFEVPRVARIAVAVVIAAPTIFILATAGGPRLWRMSADRSSATAEGTAARSTEPTANRRAGNDAAVPGTLAAPRDLASVAGTTEKPRGAGATPTGSGMPDDRGPIQQRQAEDANQSAGDVRAARAGPLASSTAGVGGAGSARTTGGSLTDQTSESGGVSGGALMPGSRTSPSKVATAPPSPSSAYRAAWSKGEAAISQNRVPPDLRAYVKRYFIAIRPGERP